MGDFGQQARTTGGGAANRRSVLSRVRMVTGVVRGALALAALATLGLSSCSRGAPAGRASDAGRGVEPDPGRGARLALPPVPPCALVPAPDMTRARAPGEQGALRVQLPSEPPHLNPLADSLEVVDQVTRGLVYETLVECVGGRAAPALADSWTWSPDGMRLELHLRPEVNWHDGRSVNAIDAQATIEASLRSTSRLAAARASLADVAAVEVMADRRVRLRLARPSTIVLRSLCDLPIVPERLIRGSSVERARLGKQPIGTGPFRFAAWEPGSQIRLEANPRPWRQPPRVEEIVFEIDADTGSSLRKLRRGELDLMPRLPEIHHPEQVTAAALGPRLRALRFDESRFSFVALNHRRPALQDPRVRQALDHLWNRPRLAADLHHDLARPIATMGRSSLEPVPFSPPAAGRLLDEAGWKDSVGDRFREQGGQPLALALVHAPGAAEQAAQRFALDAARAGVRVQLQPVDPGQLRDRLRAGEFDLALLSWRGRPDEDLRPLFGQGGAFNHGAFASASVQTLLDQIANAPDVEAAAGPPDDAQAALASALASERPALFLFQHQQVTVASTAVHGLCHDGVDLDLRRVWLAP
jgi:peptide/nickel transport system substrate-binding protein